MAEIKIYGTLVNDTIDPTIVNTDQAWDKELGKYQSEINQERIQSGEDIKTELTELVNKEVSDRKAADTALEGRVTTVINTETTNREAADTALGARIDKEITDRGAADTKLKNDLTTVINTETTNRTNADNALGARIDKEITDRTNADTALGTRIDAEAQARTDADAALKTELKADVKTVNDALTAFKNTKAQANGLASLGSDGKVPAEQLPSYVDDVIDVYATYDVSATNQVSNIKLYKDAAHTQAVTGEAGKSYNDITAGNPGYQFRWSGTTWVQITSGGLILGEITGTAYDGKKGKDLRDSVDSIYYKLLTNFSDGSPSIGESTVQFWYGQITRNAGKYGAIENKSMSIPAATSTTAGVMTRADKIKLDTTLPNQISAEATARANADTALGKRIDDEATARNAAIDAAKDEMAADLVQEGIDRDAAIKVAKDAVQAAVDKEVADRKAADTALDTKLTGLVNTEATNRASADTALGARVDKEIKDRGDAITASETKMTKLVTDETAARTTADNTLQGNINAEVNNRKTEITRVEGLIDDETAARASADTATNTKVDSHIANKSNPHGVTKAQIGLGNVSNTSDADKPISTAQATAIADAKKAGTDASTALNTHINNKSNPHSVTREQLGLGAGTAVTFNKVSAPSGLWKESDIRLKTFITPLYHSIEDICSIPTDSFMIRGNHDIGTIAQDIEVTFPELVSEIETSSQNVPNPEDFETIEKDGETYVLVKEVDYSKMSVLAIEGIKLLKAEIEDLKKQLNLK